MAETLEEKEADANTMGARDHENFNTLPTIDLDWDMDTELNEPCNYVTDDAYGFLAKGRDYQPADVSHVYTKEERSTLGTYESQDYLPSYSLVYKAWLRQQKEKRLNLARWIMMGSIGFTVGFIGFLMHQFIEVLSNVRWRNAQEFVQNEGFLAAWLWSLFFSAVCALISSAIVVFLRSSAGGSGIPEVTGFLNGTLVRHVFNIKTMFVKFISCTLAVGGGMPVGPEGPMIHLGALVGAGLSQLRSETLKIDLPLFNRFRNTEDRRNFISAGVAAGVASAFGAPVGGLLFSMEEVSSFWTTTLSWQIFFCCMVSTITTDLFNSAISGLQFTGVFGQFRKERYILFNIDKGIDINILIFIPTIVIGCIGGLLAALFTFLNLKMARTRKKFLSKIQSSLMQKFVRCFEPVVLMMIVTSVSVFLPTGFSCTKFRCSIGQVGNISSTCYNDSKTIMHVESSVVRYQCPKGEYNQTGSVWLTNGSYNEVATLFFLTGEDAVKHLFSRGTHLQFDLVSLATVCILYFFFVCWATGTAVSGGMLVPMLFIGGLYGRFVGVILVKILMYSGSRDPHNWSWIDPGAFALVGAASFFGGVTRLTMAVTVIMMELTNDVQFLLPIMLSIMVSKWLGDFFTHPICHSLLELKCIPFLRAEPRLIIGSKRMNPELYTARDVMSRPVVTITSLESVSGLANILLTTGHSGFPVIKQKFDQPDGRYFHGLINRMELYVLLMKEELFQSIEGVHLEMNDENKSVTWLNYSELTIEKLPNPELTMKKLQRYAEEERYQSLYVDLTPFINESAMCISERFSLYRTYMIFRTLGLRHLVVVNDWNQVEGIITRKDLMDFSMVERVSASTERRGKLNTVLARRVSLDTWDVKAMWDSSPAASELTVQRNEKDA